MEREYNPLFGMEKERSRVEIMTVVFMFPGQSSRYPEMFEKLIELDPANKELIEQASQILGRDLLKHYSSSNEAIFGCNLDIQVGVFLANHLFLRMLQKNGIEADYSLGLSLGEWNHLVHIGALDFEEALLAVEERGKAYDAGPSGAMASMFPVSLEDLEEIVEKARQFGELEIVNLNSPRQQVISGETAAVEEALRLAEDELFIQGVIIERQVPMHASMFKPVGDRFRAYLEKVSFKTPRLPYFPNRLGKIVENPTQETFVELLSTHVHQPVLWRHSIDYILEKEPEAVMVEVGLKGVLTNLIDRRWHKGVKKLKVDSAKETAEHFANVVAELKELR